MKDALRRRIGLVAALAALCLAFQAWPAGAVTGLQPQNSSSTFSPSSAGAWVPLAGLVVPGGTVDSIAVAASDSKRLYGLLTGPVGERLFRSDDAALTWQGVYTFTAPVTQLAVDPTVTSTVYAGAPDGLFRSTDDGLHWTQVYTLGQQIVVVSPTLIYVGGPIGPEGPGCPGGQLGVARSGDGGVSWQLHGIACGLTLTGLAASSAQPNVVFASHYYDPTVERSDDGGQTWHGVLSSNGGDKYGYVHSLLLDPADPARVYAADFYGVMVSPDEGQTWQRSLRLPCCGSAVLAASGGRVYATPGVNSGPPYTIYRTDDGGQTWWSAVQQLPAAPNVLIADPVLTDTLYASPWQYGVFKSTTGGGSWSEMDNGIQTLAPVAALTEAKQARVIYAAVNKPRGGLYRTTNAGITWTVSLSNTALVAVAANPANPDRAFAANGTSAFETHDGQTWTQIMTDYLESVQVDALALPAQDPERPYFGGLTPSSPFRQGVVVRRDPTQAVWPVRTLGNVSIVLGLAIDPHNPATVYAGGAGTLKFNGFFRSDDYGVTWHVKDYAGPYLGYQAVAVDPVQSNIVYAAALDDEGAIRSTDRGDHWQRISTGLPLSSPSAYALAVDDLGTPYAATNDGVYLWDETQGHWTPFGLHGRTAWALAIEQGAPEILMAGTDMGIWKLVLNRWSAWLPIIGR